MSRIRLVPVMVIALVSLVVLFGGWWAYRQYNIVNPLKASLEGVSGVRSVQVETGNPSVVDVTLGPVSDLQSTYLNIASAVRGIVGDPSAVTVHIQDNRSQELTNAYEETLEPIVLEGVRKGNYTEMIAAVKQKASELNIQAKITMDAHNVYVQLMKDNRYFYDVMPYTLKEGGGTS
jgi:hypothetical protein